jgi:hypothetical protein
MPEVLLLTEDLQILRLYQEQQIQLLLISKRSLNTRSSDNYRVVLSRITIVNKRRGGEASRLLLSSYTKRPDWREAANTEITRSLKPMH